MDSENCSTDDSPVFSVSWVCAQVRLRLWRYGAVCLYRVSHVEVRKGEENSNDLADPARPTCLVWYGLFALW
jgi:hypothetical protein